MERDGDRPTVRNAVAQRMTERGTKQAAAQEPLPLRVPGANGPPFPAPQWKPGASGWAEPKPDIMRRVSKGLKRL